MNKSNVSRKRLIIIVAVFAVIIGVLCFSAFLYAQPITRNSNVSLLGWVHSAPSGGSFEFFRRRLPPCPLGAMCEPELVIVRVDQHTIVAVDHKGAPLSDLHEDVGARMVGYWINEDQLLFYAISILANSNPSAGYTGL